MDVSPSGRDDEQPRPVRAAEHPPALERENVPTPGATCVASRTRGRVTDARRKSTNTVHFHAGGSDPLMQKAGLRPPGAGEGQGVGV